MRPIGGKTRPKLDNFHVESLPKFSPEFDQFSDLIQIANLKPRIVDCMNNGQYFGHNSLKTGANDLKFISLESLDIGLQLW